jgi:hypothetical protein
VSDLYDPKGSAKSVHRDLNKLRVKLALSKDSSLVNLSSKKDIENAFLLTTRSSCMLSMNCGKALACSDSFSTGTVSDSYKKDRNLKRVESKDRVKNILHAANNKSDFDMVSLIQSVDN